MGSSSTDQPSRKVSKLSQLTAAVHRQEEFSTTADLLSLQKEIMKQEHEAKMNLLQKKLEAAEAKKLYYEVKMQKSECVIIISMKWINSVSNLSNNSWMTFMAIYIIQSIDIVEKFQQINRDLVMLTRQSFKHLPPTTLRHSRSSSTQNFDCRHHFDEQFFDSNPLTDVHYSIYPTNIVTTARAAKIVQERPLIQVFSIDRYLFTTRFAIDGLLSNETR
uniref:Uncharacterized protein n=1 Tax=Romanomermis culicivorax TaxID=13658 RepID=A0A915JPV8_ROMCU